MKKIPKFTVSEYYNYGEDQKTIYTESVLATFGKSKAALYLADICISELKESNENLFPICQRIISNFYRHCKSIECSNMNFASKKVCLRLLLDNSLKEFKEHVLLQSKTIICNLINNLIVTRYKQTLKLLTSNL